MSKLNVKIARKVVEADGIASFEFISVEGAVLPPFSAGSHVDVHLPGGLIRQYSLCNDPSEQHRYQIAVLREPQSRGGSAAMHALKEGDTLQISMPRNHFSLVPAQHTLLLAGGIGVTPLLSMAERLTHLEADFALHYCTRSSERTAFRDRIAASAFARRAHIHLDSGHPEQRLDMAATLGPARADVHVYICGPSGFIDYALTTARARGWPAAQLHVEYFAGATATADPVESFEVKAASSGKCFTVPAGKSVAEVLIANGIDLQLSCEQGVCGTCILRVLEGMPDHRDLILSDEEKAANDQFTPCCSRSLSPLLVLDI